MREPDVTIFRPDPPRMTTLETSGGLRLSFECANGEHIWLSMRGQKPKGKCQCGAKVYEPAKPATATDAEGAT